MNNRLLIGLLSCLTGASNIVIAEESPVELSKITISDTRSETTNLNIPGLITVIDAEQIENSGAFNLADVLRTTGGIQFSDLFGDGTETSIGLRGFSETSGQNTLVLIDGRRLNNADLSNPDLNAVSVKDIERIEIVKGSSTVLFGDKAVGGVINIITRNPQSLRILSDISFGSFDRRNAFISVEDYLENGFGYRIRAKDNKSDNFRDNNNTETTDFFGKGFYEHGSGKVFFEYQNIDEDQRVPGALFASEITVNRRQSAIPQNFVDTRSEIGRIGFTQHLGDQFELQAEYTNRKTNSGGRLDFRTFPSTIDIDRNHKELTPRIIFTQDSDYGDRLLTFGADIFETDYLLTSGIGITDNVQSQRSLYLHGILPTSEKLTFSGGARRARVENDLIDTFGAASGIEIDDKQTSWEVGASYKANDNLRLFVKTDENFRFVVADEFSSALSAFPTAFAPPTTQSGKSHEIGAEWQNNLTSISLELYQLSLDNEIAFDPGRGANLNIGDSKRRGAIASVQHQINPRWSARVNVSYIDHKITSGAFSDSRIPLVANRTATLSTNYKFNNHFSAYYELIASSERILGGDFDNSASRLSGHAVNNLNLRYTTNALTFSLRVNNLFDKQYNDNGNTSSFNPDSFFPAPERNFLFTIQYNHEVI